MPIHGAFFRYKPKIYGTDHAKMVEYLYQVFQPEARLYTRLLGRQDFFSRLLGVFNKGAELLIDHDEPAHPLYRYFSGKFIAEKVRNVYSLLFSHFVNLKLHHGINIAFLRENGVKFLEAFGCARDFEIDKPIPKAQLDMFFEDFNRAFVSLLINVNLSFIYRDNIEWIACEMILIQRDFFKESVSSATVSSRQEKDPAMAVSGRKITTV